jgi:hypothetical protein
MLAKLHQRLTFANVVSVVALFVALGGTSIAAVTLKRNAVKGKHIAKNAVTAPKVKDASLLSEDFAPGQLPKGDPGPPGDPGVPGAPGNAAASALVGRVENVPQAIQNCNGCGASFAGDANGTSPANQAFSNTRAHLSPNATMVARDLSVFVPQTFDREAVTVTLVKLAASTSAPSDTALSCAMPAGTGSKTCNSGSATATIEPGSRLALKVAIGGGGTTSDPTFTVVFGWRATTP